MCSVNGQQGERYIVYAEGRNGLYLNLIVVRLKPKQGNKATCLEPSPSDRYKSLTAAMDP